jgi:hypothetical protein
MDMSKIVKMLGIDMEALNATIQPHIQALVDGLRARFDRVDQGNAALYQEVTTLRAAVDNLTSRLEAANIIKPEGSEHDNKHHLRIASGNGSH